MKKNRIYIIFIIFLIIMIAFGIYNYSHPVVDESKRIVYTGNVLRIDKELIYNENSEYSEKYNMAVKSNKKEIITINLKDNEISKYKENDKVNFYEDKGEYKITNEKPTTDYKVIWIIVPIFEIIAVIVLVIKLLYNKE